MLKETNPKSAKTNPEIIAGLCLSLQLIGKDMEKAIEEETSGDLQKAYLTLGKAKLGESLSWAGFPKLCLETEALGRRISDNRVGAAHQRQRTKRTQYSSHPKGSLMLGRPVEQGSQVSIPASVRHGS